MAEDRFRTMVVDDDAIVRGWVRNALAGTEFELAGEAAEPAAALALLERRRVDILLVDYHLAGRSGLDLVGELRRRGDATPVVLITASVEAALNERAREAGAQGTALKSSDPDDLLAALRAAAEGVERFAAPHPRRGPGERPLAPREREILLLVAEGLTNSEIGAALGLGSETVKTMLERACAKLGVRRRTEAVTVARRRGLL